MFPENRKNCRRFHLTLIFSTIVFIIMFLAMGVLLVGLYLLHQFQFIDKLKLQNLSILSFAFISLLLGTVFAALLSKLPLKPLREMMQATERVAAGDYSTRIHLNGLEELRRLSESFNHMVAEINSVEMLRNDFVNNFSHEFKTPIVSIRGFAKMLKRNDLTQEERNEYLDIIIDESERLAELSTNVLNLSRLEQQTIITDKAHCNISEQIRLAIALIDSKWADKHIHISMDCPELFLYGNEELLKQVWINLLDNAYKFSPEGGTVRISGSVSEGHVNLTFRNPGEQLSQETAAHLFDKFYQGDSSHTTKGNGLGLAIVKRILELHEGSVTVQNEGDREIAFLITLPERA